MNASRIRILHISPQPVETVERYAAEGFDVAHQLQTSMRKACIDLDMETVFTEKGVPEPEDMRDFHGLVVTGSVHSVCAAPDWEPALERLLREAIESHKAVLGIGDGHRAAVQALGGTVEPGECGPEVGTVPMTLTAHGIADPLFEGFHLGLYAESVHSDVVTELPKHPDIPVWTLAHSERYRNQAFAMGPRASTVQFHPEITPAMLEALMKLEPPSSAIESSSRQRVFAQEDGERVLWNYVRNFVLGKGRGQGLRSR